MRPLRQYIENALRRVRAEPIEEGSRWLARFEGIPGLPQIEADTEEQCLEEIKIELERWLVQSLRRDLELPELDGVSLNFGGGRGQRW
ncbi:MAG: hypothetical protein EXR50_06305 [Dehalococcoidia bacterium]|nr:hypothetical protein [Dehalococcoidia bacterium]